MQTEATLCKVEPCLAQIRYFKKPCLLGTGKVLNKKKQTNANGKVKPPSIEEIEKVIAKGPHNNPMGQANTKKISECFVKSIVENKPELRNNSFSSSINSLSSVLAANVSASLGGEKINIKEFEYSNKYSNYRKK